MNVFLIVISYILVFSLGVIAYVLFIGFIRKSGDYSGTLKVIRDENKVLYSLEFDEDPIILQDMSEVVFKVDTSDQSSDRK